MKSKNFEEKETVLNYTTQRYQLSRPNKVGAVMKLIRDCQPKSYNEWVDYYFKNAYTDNKDKTKIDKKLLKELGERLFIKIKEIVQPTWEEVFRTLSINDCIDYIFNLTLNRTYDGFIREKSIINDELKKSFPEVDFIESPPKLDYSGDIDYLGKIGKKSFGIQIKPITAQANFSGYSLTERMKKSFENFTKEYNGKVFIVFSKEKKIANLDIINDIGAEIKRLKGEK